MNYDLVSKCWPPHFINWADNKKNSTRIQAECRGSDPFNPQTLTRTLCEEPVPMKNLTFFWWVNIVEPLAQEPVLCEEPAHTRSLASLFWWVNIQEPLAQEPVHGPPIHKQAKWSLNRPLSTDPWTCWQFPTGHIDTDQYVKWLIIVLCTAGSHWPLTANIRPAWDD